MLWQSVGEAVKKECPQKCVNAVKRRRVKRHSA